LVRNLELAGVTNAVVLNEKPETLAGRFGGYFDAVLIDAPCSGEGMFRRDRSSVKKYDANKPEACAKTQRELLYHASRMLKPGRRLVYSTCTFNCGENENIIDPFLSANAGFSLTNKTRIWPHLNEGEGHFAALLSKQDEEFVDEPEQKPKFVPKADGKNLYPFYHFTESFIYGGKSHFSGKLSLHGTTLFLAPEDLPPLSGLRVLREGTPLGEIKNGRFSPSQALAMILTKQDTRYTAELSGEEIAKYLRGEKIEERESLLNTADIEKKAYVLMCAGGYPLGWAVWNGGILKNKLPVGWAVN
jgi:NOL1/NOP2/fmu family ribosome biogenesis protein